MISQKETIDKIDEKTLLDLIQQSFSVNGLTVAESKEIAMAVTLEKKLTKIPSIESNEPLKVYFTHDIDWINPTHLYSIVKTILSTKKWLTFNQLFQSAIYLKNIEKLIAFEESQNIKSIFLVGGNNSLFSLKRFDIRYTEHSSNYNQLFDILKSNQIEIGLHSQQNLKLTEQIYILEKFSGNNIKFHRCHFLKFDPLNLWTELSKNNIEVDFSIGSSREIGFKTGIPCHYKSIDFVNQKVLKTKIIPTILSDNAFFFQDKNSVFEQFKYTLNTAKQFGASVAVLFHPENMLIKPELWEYYIEIINICKNEGALFN